MKLITTMTMSVLVLAGLALRAGAADVTDPQARMTAGKLAIDAGRTDEAERVFGALAADASAPEALRCEARVRQASAVATSGDSRRAADLFVSASHDCSAQAEAMRLLVEAVSGVEQDPATWRGKTERVGLLTIEKGSDVHLVVVIGDKFTATGDGTTVSVVSERYPSTVPASDHETSTGGTSPPAELRLGGGGGKPISLSLGFTTLSDLLEMLGRITGRAFRCDSPATCARKVSVEFTNEPWEQALARLLQTNGLAWEQDGEGVRVFQVEPPEFTGEPISISMKDATISDVLKLLSQFTGLVIRCDAAATCARTITLELVDVPWDQALWLILQTNGLRSEQDADGIRVFRRDGSQPR